MPIPVLGQPGFGMDLKNRFRGYAANNPQINNFPTPLSTSSSATTLTSAQVINGIATFSGNATAIITLPTAANLKQALNAYLDLQGVQVGDTIDILICNANTSTLSLAAGTGGTADTNGSSTLATGISKTVFIRFTNVTPGLEAYVFYA